MSSTGVNVLRWSALAVGLVYGFTHQRAIYAQNHAHHEQEKYHKREQLIQKAKLEWAKKSLPAEAKTSSGDVISDPNDPHFDLEAYLTKVAAEN